MHDVVTDLLEHGKRNVVCTHRPVLPALWKALGIDDVRLEPGEMLVVHHRRGKVLGTGDASHPLSQGLAASFT